MDISLTNSFSKNFSLLAVLIINSQLLRIPISLTALILQG